MIRFTVPGKPQAWQRARLGRGGHHFTDNKTRSMKALVVMAFQKAAPKNHRPWIGPVSLSVKAYFPIPKSQSKKNQAVLLSETVPYLHKSDWDNVGKLISDALNQVAFVDDAQVCDATVKKYYSGAPRVEVEVQELP